MSGQEHQTNWMARVGEFPWRREREQLLREMHARKESGKYELDDRGNRKGSKQIPVGKVIVFARVARKQPEIWQMIEEYAKRAKSNPDEIPTKDENTFFRFFADWYIAKHDFPYITNGFLSAYGLLIRIAREEIPDNLETQEVREILLGDLFVFEADDIEQQNNR